MEGCTLEIILSMSVALLLYKCVYITYRQVRKREDIIVVQDAVVVNVWILQSWHMAVTLMDVEWFSSTNKLSRMEGYPHGCHCTECRTWRFSDECHSLCRR